MTCNYLSDIFDNANRNKIIKNLVRSIKQHTDLDFNAVVVTGVSGLIVGPQVASKLKKQLIVIRKSEKTHSENSVEHLIKYKYDCGTILKYIVIDDLIETGKTIRRIKKKLQYEFDDCKLESKGIFLYHNQRTRRRRILKAPQFLMSVIKNHRHKFFTPFRKSERLYKHEHNISK